MKKVSHKKKWKAGLLQMHVDPPPTPLIKSNQNDKSGKDFVKLKLRRDQTSAKSNPYEFEIDFFDNGELEDFLLFVRNFNMPLAM